MRGIHRIVMESRKCFFESWELLARRNDVTNLLDFNLEQINDILCISRRL